VRLSLRASREQKGKKLQHQMRGSTATDWRKRGVEQAIIRLMKSRYPQKVTSSVSKHGADSKPD
jgi:hypothetical protein